MMASNNILTAEQIENDPNFKSFLSYTEAPDMDNTNADNMAFVKRQASKMQGSLLAEAMDRNNTTTVLKDAFERWYSELEKRQLLTIRKDVELALGNENPETMKIQDIFKKMAAKVQLSYCTLNHVAHEIRMSVCVCIRTSFVCVSVCVSITLVSFYNLISLHSVPTYRNHVGNL